MLQAATVAAAELREIMREYEMRLGAKRSKAERKNSSGNGRIQKTSDSPGVRRLIRKRKRGKCSVRTVCYITE